MNKDKPLKTSWQKKIAIKDEKLSVKKYQEKIIETRRYFIVAFPLKFEPLTVKNLQIVLVVCNIL